MEKVKLSRWFKIKNYFIKPFLPYLFFTVLGIVGAVLIGVNFIEGVKSAENEKQSFRVIEKNNLPTGNYMIIQDTLTDCHYIYFNKNNVLPRYDKYKRQVCEN